jgi:hypothetical protein
LVSVIKILLQLNGRGSNSTDNDNSLLKRRKGLRSIRGKSKESDRTTSGLCKKSSSYSSSVRRWRGGYGRNKRKAKG